ncbi:unnamed protein product, partial [Brenthis ino]
MTLAFRLTNGEVGSAAARQAAFDPPPGTLPLARRKLPSLPLLCPLRWLNSICHNTELYVDGECSADCLEIDKLYEHVLALSRRRADLPTATPPSNSPPVLSILSL